MYSGELRDVREVVQRDRREEEAKELLGRVSCRWRKIGRGGLGGLG